MAKNQITNPNSLLQRLAYDIPHRDQQPSSYPKVGFGLPGPESQQILFSLRWATPEERTRFLVALVVAWQKAEYDPEQFSELLELFGSRNAEFLCMPLIFTIRKKALGHFIRCRFAGRPIQAGESLFRVHCWDRNQADNFIQALENSPAVVEVLDYDKLVAA